ncbi:MAG: serine hydrolase domain-containing protein [Candidatus Thorarchaeota archaeon]|jgi:CubicO group peptidase (beta-lactamase class C family)
MRKGNLRNRSFAVPLVTLILLLPLVGFRIAHGGSIRESSNLFDSGASARAVVRDYWPTEGWRVSSPYQQVMSEPRLNSMLEYIAAQDYSIDSVVIVRHGYIVLEEYLNPEHDVTTRHEIYSCTKSFISALVGAAIEEGLVAGVEQKVLSFFPNRTFDNMDSRKENITLEDMLTMTPGLEWHELDIPYSSPDNSFRLMYSTSDWVQYVLDRPMAQDPGEVWNYNSGASHILSVILQNLSSSSPADYIDWVTSHIYNPLGIGGLTWYDDPQGNYFGGSGMRLTPREMAKFGYLFLNNGSWDGEQIIPEAWVEVSTSSQAERSSSTHYGYQWWVFPDIGMYAAHGYGGQNIIVVPEYDMVVVFTSSLPEDQWPFPHFVSEYIIPAALDGPVMAFPPLSPYLVTAIVVIGVVAIVAVVARNRLRSS